MKPRIEWVIRCPRCHKPKPFAFSTLCNDCLQEMREGWPDVEPTR